MLNSQLIYVIPATNEQYFFTLMFWECTYFIKVKYFNTLLSYLRVFTYKAKACPISFTQSSQFAATIPLNYVKMTV